MQHICLCGPQHIRVGMTGQAHICSALASQPKAVPTPTTSYWHKLFHMPGAKPEIISLSANKNASTSGSGFAAAPYGFLVVSKFSGNPDAVCYKITKCHAVGQG